MHSQYFLMSIQMNTVLRTSDFWLISKSNRDFSHKHNMVSNLALCKFTCRREANYEVIHHVSVPTTIRMQIVVPVHQRILDPVIPLLEGLVIQPHCQCSYCLTAFFQNFRPLSFLVSEPWLNYIWQLHIQLSESY